MKKVNAKIGVSKGIYWTQKKGAKLFKIITTIKKGTGRLYIEGNIGHDLLESIETVLHILKNSLKAMDIVIKLPKILDGSSAGLPIFMSVYSALKNHPLSQEIAYTGELDREGNILKVGKIPEKFQAARAAKMQIITLPLSNFFDLPKEEGLIIWCMANIQDIIDELFF